MSVTGYFNDVQFLIAAHHVETALTTDSLKALMSAFASYGSNARRITAAGFVKAVQDVTLQLPDEVLKEHFTEHALRQWFSWLDSDSSGTVEWHQFETALSTASAMQKYQTVLDGKNITQTKLTVQMCEKVVFVDCWRRSVVCSSSKDVKMYSAAGAMLGQLSGHSAAVSNAVFLRHLGQLCTVGCDRQVLLWDHKHASPVKQFLLPSPAMCAVHEPTSGLLWLGGMDGYLSAYNITTSATPALARRSQAKHSDWIKDLMHIPELSLLVSASLDGTVRMWGLDGQLLCTKLGHTRPVYFLSYMAHLGLLFSAGQGKEICVWNPFSMDAAPVQLLHGHEREMVGLQADLLNRSVVSCDAGGRLVVWDASRLGQKLQVLDLAACVSGLHPIRSMSQNPATREIVLVTNSSFLRVPSPLSSQRPPKLGNKVIRLLVSPTVKLVIAATAQAIHVYDLLDGKAVACAEAPFGAGTAIRGLSLLNSLQLAAFSEDHRIALMPLREFGLEPSSKLRRLQGVLMPNKFSDVIAAASMQYSLEMTLPCQIVFVDGTCAEYKFTKSAAVQLSRETVLPFRGASVKSVEYASDLNFAVVLSSEGVVALWDWKLHSARQILPPAGGQGYSRRSTTEQSLLGDSSASGDGSFLTIQQILLHRSRNALLAMHAQGIVVLNLGNFMQLIKIDYDCLVVAPLATTASSPPHQSAGSNPSSPSSSSVSAAVGSRVLLGSHMALLDGDTLWATTSLPGQVAVIPLLTSFAYFFSSQTRSITADSTLPRASVTAELSASTSVQNTHFVILNNFRSSVTASLFYGLDRRSSESVVAKVYNDLGSHVTDVRKRLLLGDARAPYFVSYLATWDSNEELPKGTWPHCIIMEKGETTLREKVLEGTMTQQEKDFACLSVLHVVLQAMQAGLMPTDLRTRNFVRVGDAWKFCAVDTLREPGELWGRRIFAATCPPEFCAMSGAITTCPPLPECAPIVSWLVAVTVFEIQTSSAAFFDRNENFLYTSVQNVTSGELQELVGKVPTSSAAKSILSALLVLEPGQRGRVAEPLINLLRVRGYSIDYASLFYRANCWRNGQMTAFPPFVSEAAVQVTRRASEDQLAPLALEHVSQIVTCAAFPSADVFVCVDSKAVHNGDGAIHLFSKSGESCGFVPPPELGDESLAEWLWPNQDDLYARQEALQRPGQRKEKGSSGAITEVDDAVLEQLAPPPGWQNMTRDEIAQEMLQHFDFSQQPTSTRECVEQFVKSMLRKSPFFRGGQLEGDPIPLYSSPAKQTKSTSHSLVDKSTIDEARRRKWKKYWDNLRAELGGNDRRSLPTDFLLRLPTLGHDSDSVNESVSTLFGGDSCLNGSFDEVTLSPGRLSPITRSKVRRPARHEVALVHDNALTVLDRIDRLDAEEMLRRQPGFESQVEEELAEAGRRAALRRAEAKAKKMQQGRR